MGRAVEPSGDAEDDSAEDAEDDADESARKKRKVVLVKAAAAKRSPGTTPAPAPKGADGEDGNAATRNRLKPASMAGGTAGRILEWLGHRSRERPAERASRPALQKDQKATKPSALASAAAAAAASTEAGPSRSRPPADTTKRIEASRPSSTSTKASKTKTTQSAKSGTEVKKTILSKRTAPSGASGKKTSSAAPRSASPCSETPARKGSSSKTAAAGSSGSAARPARTTKVKVKTASVKKVAKSTRPGKAGASLPAGNSNAAPASAGAASGGMSAKAKDSESSASRSRSRSRSTSSSRSPSPAPARAQPVKAPPVRPLKRPRTTPASPKPVKKTSPLVVPASPLVASAVVATPPRRPVLSAADEGSFQDAVLDRLRSLCGENEDAKVLAEYIVVMVAGNKGRDEMSAELKPFFQEKAQAESFVDWVEECKWKFLTGGPSPAKTASSAGSPAPKQQAAASSSSAPRSSPPADFWGPAPTRTLRVSASSRSAEASKSLRHGPHVAVTSRCVLQPNPNFDDSPSPPRKAATGVAYSKAAATSRSPARAAVAPAVAKPVASAAPSAPVAAVPARGQKNELLDNMTKQLQLILTKLQDKTLPDESREKYQTMAQSIQTQMAKIAPKKPPPVRGRR
eukprot:TRINITY_DN40165_c0_g1_i1.p1 TRINITY_DN40165_c0_g1~~TRINITY_DN40165_c0_g1_i1.p1  ORF type:complete len:631 (-),score=135.26 TRINITY_DN40165_c0_g1_i1:59-1951(-)